LPLGFNQHDALFAANQMPNFTLKRKLDRKATGKFFVTILWQAWTFLGNKNCSNTESTEENQSYIFLNIQSNLFKYFNISLLCFFFLIV